MSETFLVIYRPGPAWRAGLPARDQPPPEHGRYLLDLYHQGHLQAAGPFGDETGAALVIEAPDAAQAKTLIDADPAVVQAIFTVEIHLWALIPWAHYGHKPKTHP